MSWLDAKGSKGNWSKAKQHEQFLGNDWHDGKSRPVHTLVSQKTGSVTLKSFFTKIGDFFLSLK